MVKNLILSIIALAILAGCSGKKDKTTEETVEAVPVKVQKLEKTNIAKTLDYTANLQADKQVYYAPAATGRIEKIYVEVGDRIKKGQLLVEMDRTQLVQAEVQLKNLETEYNRAVQLNETGSISKQAYDAAVTQYEVAKANVDFLKENTTTAITPLASDRIRKVFNIVTCYSLFIPPDRKWTVGSFPI